MSHQCLFIPELHFPFMARQLNHGNSGACFQHLGLFCIKLMGPTLDSENEQKGCVSFCCSCVSFRGPPYYLKDYKRSHLKAIMNRFFGVCNKPSVARTVFTTVFSIFLHLMDNNILTSKRPRWDHTQQKHSVSPCIFFFLPQ